MKLSRPQVVTPPAPAHVVRLLDEEIAKIVAVIDSERPPRPVKPRRPRKGGGHAKAA
ncbi:MAG: hypothetical protein ACTHOR_16660 [Devosia sp.]|jgi:hypothetical protein